MFRVFLRNFKKFFRYYRICFGRCVKVWWLFIQKNHNIYTCNPSAFIKIFSGHDKKKQDVKGRCIIPRQMNSIIVCQELAYSANWANCVYTALIALFSKGAISACVCAWVHRTRSGAVLREECWLRAEGYARVFVALGGWLIGCSQLRDMWPCCCC